MLKYIFFKVESDYIESLLSLIKIPQPVIHEEEKDVYLGENLENKVIGYIIFLKLYLIPAREYLARKKFARNIFKCVYLSLFIITKLFFFKVLISFPLG